MRAKIYAAIVLLVLTACDCNAALEFSGYMLTGQESKFMLTDTIEATSSGWLAIGENFHGYALKAYDSAKKLLQLEHEGTTIELKLQDEKVREGKVRPASNMELLETLAKNGDKSVEYLLQHLQRLESERDETAARVAAAEAKAKSDGQAPETASMKRQLATEESSVAQMRRRLDDVAETYSKK
jgi:hypothetical protein